MSRLPTIHPETASPVAKDLLDKTQAQLGRLPNLYHTMANAPAALDGYLAFRSALAKGVLSVQMRERIALLTAAINDCGYCLSAHTLRGAKVGLSESELTGTQKSESADPKVRAALEFVNALVQHKGDVSDQALADVKASGWSDEEVSEMLAHVALNVFSNYFNHLAQPELDFPAVRSVR